jgi:hypothetical protein
VNNLFVIVHLIATPIQPYCYVTGAAVDCAATNRR